MLAVRDLLALLTIAAAMPVQPRAAPSTAPSTAPSAKPWVYRSKTYGYQITLPAGWSVVPQAELKRELGQMVSKSAEAKYEMNAVFYLGENDSRRAMVQAQVHRYASNSEPDARQMRLIMQNFAGTDSAGRDLTTRASNLAKEATVSEPKLDVGNRIFTFDAVLPHPVLGNIRQRVVGHFGHTEMVAVSCMAPENEFPALEREFLQIQESFRFDKSAAYQGRPWSQMTAIIVASILALVYLVFRLGFRRRRRREI